MWVKLTKAKRVNNKRLIMSKLHNIDSLLDIADQIDAVFVDMFGVLWDGEAVLLLQ